MPKLYIDEDGAESVYEIFDSEVTLGRGAANAVQVHDSHASKMHAVVRRVQGHWKLIDLESKNGTRVNGRFRNQHWLSDGDVLAIGTSTVRYAAEGAPQGSPAAAAGVAVAPRPAAPKAAPAKPAPAVPAPPRPAPEPPARPALAEQPLEAPAAAPAPAAPTPAPTAAAPAPAPTRARRGGAPVSARRRPPRDDRHDEYGDEEERPRYRSSSSNSTIIVLGIFGAVAFVVLMFAMFGKSMSVNEEAFAKADRMADKRQYEEAIRYAEQHADPDAAGYTRLLNGIRNWKKRLQAQKDLEREKAAREYYDYQIYRKQAITGRRRGGFRAKDALPDREVVRLLREFLAKYRGTSTASEIMHSELADYRHFRDAMREYADPELKSTTVLQAEQTQLDIDVSARLYGKAYRNLEYVRDMNRLCMTSENYNELRKAVELKLEDIRGRAETTFRTEAGQFNQHMDGGRRGQARQLLEKMKEQYAGLDELARKVRELAQRF